MLISTEKYQVKYLEAPMDQEIIWATKSAPWGLVQNGTRNYLQRELQPLRWQLVRRIGEDLQRTELENVNKYRKSNP